MFCKTLKACLFVPIILMLFAQTVLAEEFSNTLDSVKVKSTGNKSVVVDVYVNSSDTKIKPQLSSRKYEKDKYVIDLLNVTQKGNVSKDTSSSNDLVKNKNVKVGKVEGGTARVILNLDNPDVEVKEVRYHIVPGKPKTAAEINAKPDQPAKSENRTDKSITKPVNTNKTDNKTNLVASKSSATPKAAAAPVKVETKVPVVKQEKPKLVPKQTKGSVKVIAKNFDKVNNKPKALPKPVNTKVPVVKAPPKQDNKVAKVNPVSKEVKNTGPSFIHKTDNNLVAANNTENSGPQIIHKTNSNVQPVANSVNKVSNEVKTLTKPQVFKPSPEVKTLTKPQVFKPTPDAKTLTKPQVFKPTPETRTIKPSNVIPKTNISLDLPSEKKIVSTKPAQVNQNKQQNKTNQVKPASQPVAKVAVSDKPKQSTNKATVQPVKPNDNVKIEPVKAPPVAVKTAEPANVETKTELAKLPESKPSNIVDKSHENDKKLLAQAEPKPAAAKKSVDPEQIPINIEKNTAESEVRTVDVNAGGTDIGSLFFTLLGALVIVIPLIFIVIWLINIFHKGGDAGALKGLTAFGGEKFKILSSTSLGQGRSIHLVEIKGRQLVIGCTNNSINILTEFTDFDEFVEENKAEVLPSKSPNVSVKHKKGRAPLGSFADLYKDYKTKIDAEDLEDEY